MLLQAIALHLHLHLVVLLLLSATSQLLEVALVLLTSSQVESPSLAFLGVCKFQGSEVGVELLVHLDSSICGCFLLDSIGSSQSYQVSGSPALQTLLEIVLEAFVSDSAHALVLRVATHSAQLETRAVGLSLRVASSAGRWGHQGLNELLVLTHSFARLSLLGVESAVDEFKEVLL